MVTALSVLFSRVVRERVGTIILSAFVAHSAWHWFLERGATLRQYRIGWPALDVALAATAVRGLLVLLVIIGCGWGTYLLTRRLGVTPTLLPEAPERGTNE
jgi:hypothetical protein